MLHIQCFTSSWLREQAVAIGSKNPVMLEKATVALQLLGHLAESGLAFQFKGGTSLLLRLNPIRRLSIDVDIVTQASPAELRVVLDQIGKLKPFVGYEHAVKRDCDLPPKKHFRFFYPSAIEAKIDHVLLDVLFEAREAPHCEPVVITTPFIRLEREVRVLVPTVDCLLGDKLTAFAPKTIGILYNPERKTDIAKQLFDVGVLFDAATDLRVVGEVYVAVHARQLAYRCASFSLVDTLQDAIEAGLLLSQHSLKGVPETVDGKFLFDGVNNLASHLVNLRYRHDEARVAAGKAACIAAWIQHRPPGATLEMMRFVPERVAELRDLQIQEPWTSLNSMKRINSEAFHYWYQAQCIRIS